MKIGIIGGGGVAQTLGGGLIAAGHDVTLGIRQPTQAELDKPRDMGQPLTDWLAANAGHVATMQDAAAVGEIIINATHGEVSVEALTLAGADNLAGKVLIDLSNPLDFSKGMPPALFPALSGHTSVGEQIQTAFPQTRVVKAFNTITAAVMIKPSLVPGDHDLFLSGNDADAKSTVADIARQLGWQHVVDLGDIVGSRAQEGLLPFWIRLMMTGGPIANIHVQRG